MKHLLLLMVLLQIASSCASNKTTLILDPSQSMSITGKGPGQDAAVNPFGNDRSMAIVKNIGENKFEARLQSDGKIIDTITIEPSESKSILLEKGIELYFDSDSYSKAEVSFKSASSKK